MYLEVTSLLPPDAASHYKAIRTILFARSPRWGGGGVKMGRGWVMEGGVGAEITIKGLCGGPTAELLGGFGGSPWGALEVQLLLTLLL